MKKLAYVISLLVLLLLFASCGQLADTTSTPTEPGSGGTEEPGEALPTVDVWDGTSCAPFASGDGSEANPWRITTCAELAYLAQRVAAGTSFEGKYLSLESNLDLNDKEWLQIGSSEKPFMGNFDGDGHTISNMKITKAVEYKDWSYNERGGYYEYDHYAYAGLFAFCKNASVSNMTLKDSTVNIPSTAEYDWTYVGGLVGYVMCESDNGAPVTSSLKNVKLSNVEVALTQKETKLYMGGCIGRVTIGKNGNFTADSVQCNVEVVCDKNDNSNYLGGFVGYMRCFGNVEMSNIACYATVTWPYDKGENFAGAVGGIVASESYIEMENVFSQLQLGRVHFSHCFDNAVVAKFYCVDLDDPSETWGTYSFANVFGGVKSCVPSDEHVPGLFGSGAINTSEVNCKYTFTLPEGHGFSDEVWNLKHLSRPVLK